MGELISWARIACETGYIDEKTAWEYIKYAGEQCRQTFRNWNEIGKSYLIGQAMITDKKKKPTEQSDTFSWPHKMKTVHGEKSFLPINHIIEISFKRFTNIGTRCDGVE